PRRRQVEHAQKAEHRRLPRPRRADDGEELARHDPQRHLAQGVDGHALAVDARHALELEERHHRRPHHRHPAGVAQGGRDPESDCTTTVWPRRSPRLISMYEPSLRPVVTRTSVILPEGEMTRTTSAPVPFCFTAATGTVGAFRICWSTTVIDTWAPSVPF